MPGRCEKRWTGISLCSVGFSLPAFLLSVAGAVGAQGTKDQASIENSIGMKFVLITPGEFTMGASAGEPQRADESPHRVRLTRPVYFGVHEVTVGQFRQFAQARRKRSPKQCCSDAETGKQSFLGGQAGGFMISQAGTPQWRPGLSWANPSWKQTDTHPAVFMSWNDASAFVKWLSEKEGKRYRLPTEAEWEYACRGGATTAYWWGDFPNDDAVGKENVADWSFRKSFPVLHYGWEFDDGHAYTAPVGSFKPNAFGIHDMVGNVVEWVADYYGDYYGDSRDAEKVFVDPKGPANGVDRVARGGGWGTTFNASRCAFRFRDLPENRFSGTGFRVVLEAN